MYRKILTRLYCLPSWPTRDWTLALLDHPAESVLSLTPQQIKGALEALKQVAGSTSTTSYRGLFIPATEAVGIRPS